MNKELWEQLRRGEEAAFRRIYRQHADILYSYGMRMIDDSQIVEECVQSAFIWLFEKRNSIVMPQNLGGYLMTIMKHLIYKSHRNESMFLSMDSGTVDPKYVFNLSIDMYTTMEHTDIQENRLKALQAALDTLTPQQREAIYLRYYKKMSIQDTATAMGISYQTVKNVTCNAIARLRKSELLIKAFLLLIVYLIAI